MTRLSENNERWVVGFEAEVLWSRVALSSMQDAWGEGSGGQCEADGEVAQNAVEDDGILNHDERLAPHYRNPDQKERVEDPHISLIVRELLGYVSTRRGFEEER
ncbi:MAG: hypothetical protein M3122_03950 [Actinomycetota bacterium]|nr:hypothetical protein [Actinomycetota bacterium]